MSRYTFSASGFREVKAETLKFCLGCGITLKTSIMEPEKRGESAERCRPSEPLRSTKLTTFISAPTPNPSMVFKCTAVLLNLFFSTSLSLSSFNYLQKQKGGGKKQPWCKIKTGKMLNNCIPKFKIESIRPDVTKHKQKEGLTPCVLLQRRQRRLSNRTD